MIKQYTPSQVFQLYSQSPADVQDAAISERTSDRLRNIVLERHKLSVEQLGKTAQLLGLVFFGLLHPDKLTAELQKELNIEPSQARMLYRDIWQLLLGPIELSLRRIHGPIKRLEEIEVTPLPPVAPSATPTARVMETKKPEAAPAPPAPIRPSAPPSPALAAPISKKAYLEPIEEETTQPTPPPIRKPEPKPEPKKFEIGGIPVEMPPKPEPKERPITPPRISSLYLEPIEGEEEEKTPNVVDLRGQK